jgi:predicted nucleotidyltransferase
MSAVAKAKRTHRGPAEALERRRLAPTDNVTVRRLTAEMVRRIVAQFRPERVVLFGSQARDDATWESDVDLLVVMPVNGSKRERRLAIQMALRDIHIPKDILVVTPREWDIQRSIPGTLVWPARREGVVLYERR